MTYIQKETSEYQGAPVYLYRFSRDAINYDYCSMATDLTVTTPAGTFAGSSISHGRINTSQQVRRDGVSVTLPKSDTLAASFLPIKEGFAPTSITIWRGHYTDGAGAAEFLVVFKGTVRAAKVTDRDEIELVCSSLFSSLKQIGLGAHLQVPCRHVLYHGKCGLSKATFETALDATAYSGSVVTVPDAALQADGYYSLGVLSYGGADHFIIKHETSNLTLRRMPAALAAAIDLGTTSVTLAPGCDRSFSVCRDRFNNLLNHGGFKFWPKRNPFSTGSVV